MEEKKKKPKGYINYLAIICIIGIIILLFGNSISDKDAENTKQSEVLELEQQKSGIDEAELENILSQIKGVGNVDVMITYENSGTSNYLSDTTYENRSDTKTDTKKTQKVVMSSGSPVVYEKSLPKVMGVIVVCDGAGSASVRSSIVDAVCAVTGVYEHNVGVYERK